MRSVQYSVEVFDECPRVRQPSSNHMGCMYNRITQGHPLTRAWLRNVINHGRSATSMRKKPRKAVNHQRAAGLVVMYVYAYGAPFTLFARALHRAKSIPHRPNVHNRAAYIQLVQVLRVVLLRRYITLCCMQVLLVSAMQTYFVQIVPILAWYWRAAEGSGRMTRRDSAI